jgi:crotonobetaine/carnitine-CoA ligase
MSRRYTGEWVVSSLLAERAERFGTEVAVASEEGPLTYGDLVERAARVADGLAELGTEPGDRVATMLPTGNDYLAAWHAIVWLGAIDVPVNVEYRGTFLEHILRDSGATVLVVHARWVPRLEGTDLSSVRHVVVGDEQTGALTGVTTHAFAESSATIPRHVTLRGARPDVHHVHVGQ